MNFLTEAEKLEEEILRDRRYLHSHPELSFEEKNTTEYIETRLSAFGLTPHRYPDYYGVWADLEGEKKTDDPKLLVLRADIDALPIQEETGVAYASRTPNVMHACGHDNHTAMLLAAARLLSEHRSEFSGTVRFLFQSAEESCHGAEYYVEKGLFDDADAVYGCHVWPTLDAGLVNVEAGPIMASCDNFTITVTGKAAHGAAPHRGADAILSAAAIILQLQSIVSRRVDPRESAVITVGEIRGGTRFNVIADKVELKGTVRTLSNEVRDEMEALIRNVAANTAAVYGTESELKYEYFPAVLRNDPELTKIAKRSAEKLFRAEGLGTLPINMGSEDFSYFLKKVPGVYTFLGCRNRKLGIDSPNHNSRFNVDESILKNGAALYAQFAVDYLT